MKQPQDEAGLRQILSERTQHLNRIIPLTNPNPTHKWRYVSAMQKSIRRGHSESALTTYWLKLENCPDAPTRQELASCLRGTAMIDAQILVHPQDGAYYNVKLHVLPNEGDVIRLHSATDMKSGHEPFHFYRVNKVYHEINEHPDDESRMSHAIRVAVTKIDAGNWPN